MPLSYFCTHTKRNSYKLCSQLEKKLSSQFNFAYRYIDNVLSTNNPDFDNYLDQMYPAELEIKDDTESNTSGSYLDVLLSIGRDGQLRNFNLHITSFPYLSSSIPSSTAYDVFISQLIRYARACSSYECFILRAVRLSSKLHGQGYIKEIVPQEVLWSIGGSHQTLWSLPLQMLHDILGHDRKQWHTQLIRHYTNELITDLDLITDFDIITNFGRLP